MDPHLGLPPVVPSLTELVSIDLVGGDGQEAPGGTELPQPIRFAVRNGGLPMTGARIRVTPSGGTVTDGTFTDAGIITTTGANGVAAVRWTLDPARRHDPDPDRPAPGRP